MSSSLDFTKQRADYIPNILIKFITTPFYYQISFPYIVVLLKQTLNNPLSILLEKKIVFPRHDIDSGMCDTGNSKLNCQPVTNSLVKKQLSADLID